MSWVKRVGRFFLGGGLVRDSRGKGGNAPRGRRVTVEALEDRRLLSVDFGLTAVDTGGVRWSTYSGDPVVFDDAVYFGQSGELWKMDAGENVSLVAEINPDSEWWNMPGGFAVLGNRLYFHADDGVNGRELWSADSQGNVSLVADIFPGSASSAPTDLTVFGNELYFFAQFGDPGVGLWKVDAQGNMVQVSQYADKNAWMYGDFLVVDESLYFRDPNGVLQKMDGDGGMDDLGALSPNGRFVGLGDSVYVLESGKIAHLGGPIRPSIMRVEATGERTFLSYFGPEPPDPAGFGYNQYFNQQVPTVVGERAYIAVMEETDNLDEFLTLWSINSAGTPQQVFDFGQLDFSDSDSVSASSYDDRLYFTDLDGALNAVDSSGLVVSLGDSTEEGTFRGANVFVEFEDNLYFSANNGNPPVWKLTSPDVDFGDAPDEFGTVLASDGARHLAGGPTLGATRDGEPDGMPSPGADGDDLDGTDDEDGVTFASTTFVAAATVNVQNAPSGAKLDAWIDFNQDGSFGGPGEQIADSLAVVEGDNLVTYVIPEGTVPGETYARFRLSSAGGLSPTGSAADGEVEDYVVTIIPEDTSYFQHSESVGFGSGVVTEGSLPADIGEGYIERGSQVYYRQDGEWFVTDAGNVEIPAKEEKYRAIEQGDTLVIQQSVEGEWLTEGEWDLPDRPDRFDFAHVFVEGETIVVMTEDPGAPSPEDNIEYVYIVEQVDGIWQTVYSARSENIYVTFKNGTLGIARSSFHYTPSGWSSHPILARGFIALVRKHEGEWKDSWFWAERFDADSHIFEDVDDGLGSNVVVDGEVAYGFSDGVDSRYPRVLVEPYVLKFRWSEETGSWGVVDRTTRDAYAVSVDGDVEAYSNSQDGGVSVVTPAGEKLYAVGVDIRYVMVAEGTLFYRVDDTGETHWHDVALRNEVEEFQLLLPANGQIVASASGEVLPTIEIHDPAGALVTSSVEGYLAYTATSPGVYSVSVVAGSKWIGYEFSILSELPQAGETVDLGVVDDEEVLDALGGNGAREFTLEASRDGYLTVLAHEEEVSEDLTVALLDQDGGVVAAASAVGSSGTWEHEWRLDHVVTGGESYRVLVMGSGEVDLRICNLVRQAWDTVEVFDTDSEDAYLFTVSDTFNVTANGVEYEFDDATEFTFHSAGGLDVIELVDSDGDDTLNVSPNQVVMSGTTLGGTAFSVTANGFYAAHGYAKNGGNDTAEFAGGEKGERVKAYEGLVKMMGGDYFARAKFFERVDVEMGGGVDTAVVVPSKGADVVWASGLEVRVTHNVEGAEGVLSELAAAGGDVTIDGAERIVARARGGDDWVELHDSAFDDVFIAKPNKVEMMNGPGDAFERGELYRIVARGFGQVSAIADQGGDGDVAKLYDSGEDGVDVWAAGYLDGETWSTMTSPSRLLYEVLAFEHVGGYGFNGGLGEGHGTNRREHGDDVDFVFKYGYWEGDEEPVPSNPRNPRGGR